MLHVDKNFKLETRKCNCCEKTFRCTPNSNQQYYSNLHNPGVSYFKAPLPNRSDAYKLEVRNRNGK